MGRNSKKKVQHKVVDDCLHRALYPFNRVDLIFSSSNSQRVKLKTARQVAAAWHLSCRFPATAGVATRLSALRCHKSRLGRATIAGRRRLMHVGAFIVTTALSEAGEVPLRATHDARPGRTPS